MRIQLSLVMGSCTYHVRAVNHLAHVLAEDRKLSHGSLERGHHLSLVVCGGACQLLSTMRDRSKEYALTMDCHAQAVRESRASSESDWRRISPAIGDSTSPWLPPVLQSGRSARVEDD